MSISPDVDVRPSDVDGEERDRLAHIVFPKSKLVDAMVNGTPIQALCGKVWVPSRDPKNYPLCQTCKEIAEQAGFNIPRG